MSHGAPNASDRSATMRDCPECPHCRLWPSGAASLVGTSVRSSEDTESLPNSALRTLRTTNRERPPVRTEHEPPSPPSLDVLRIERLLRQALASPHAATRALVWALDELVAADRLNRHITTRLIELHAENQELRDAIVALRERMKECGCGIGTKDEDAARSHAARRTAACARLG